MNADENPYASPSAAEEVETPQPRMTIARRRFHCVTGMWLSFGLAFTFGTFVAPQTPMPEREYLISACNGFAIIALSLAVLTAVYACQLLALRTVADTVGAFFGLGLSMVPAAWALDWWLR